MNKREAGRLAIKRLGGPTEAARKLSEIPGRTVSVSQAKQWASRGVAQGWAHIIGPMTGIAIDDLQGVNDETES